MDRLSDILRRTDIYGRGINKLMFDYDLVILSLQAKGSNRLKIYVLSMASLHSYVSSKENTGGPGV